MSLLPDVIDRYRRDREFEIAEVSERQRERLLEMLGNQSAQAAELAQSASHIAGATLGTAQSIAVAVSRMAAVADWAMPAIVEHLTLAAERLGGVEQMLANPTETAAAEFYRRGTYALSCEWWEEAVADLSEAVQRYPYNPRTWFNLGVAQQQNESADAAAEAFGRCARYGASVEPALAARAVLLAASLHRAAGRTDASVDILRDYADKIDGALNFTSPWGFIITISTVSLKHSC
jgi:lipoprotein NlpI